MSNNLQRVLKVTMLMSVGLLVLFMASIIMLRPERVSEKLLRMGGRIIQKATTNTGEVAVFGGVIVLTVWATIAVFAWRESRGTEETKGRP